MQRRAFLRLLSSGGVILTTGCAGTSEPEPGEQGTAEHTVSEPSPTATTTVPRRVREWARDAEPQGPTRPEGEPASVDQTIIDKPGYNQDNIEYFPENQTVRYVMGSGEPEEYDTWTFNEWGRIESAEVGTRRTVQVTENRLDVEGLGRGISRPPNESGGVVVFVRIEKMLDRDGNVVSWPVTTFPDLIEGAPQSVTVTLTIEGDTYTRTVPVYADYSVLQYE